MNINSVQIQFIQYAFHLNQLQAEDASKTICKNHESRLARARILLSRLEAGTLPNFAFSNEKKFDVQHHVNSQSDRVWACDEEVGPRRVTRAQGAASVMVWAAVTESVRSPLVFVEQGVKLNQENYQNDILVGSLIPWAKKHFKKTSLDVSTRFGTVTRSQKEAQEWLLANVPNFISKEE